MDVNGTRYHLLLGKHDWLHLTNGVGLDHWDASGANLTLDQKLFRFPRRNPENLSPDQRRGSARDAYHTWYWISQDEREIISLSRGGKPRHYWGPEDEISRCTASGDFKPVEPDPLPPVRIYRGLAITLDQFLIVGTVDPGGILIFDIHSGGTPVFVQWPVPFNPFDICATPDGGAAILERSPARYWRIDRYFRIHREMPYTTTPGAFKNADGSSSPQCAPRVPLSEDMAFSLAATEPVAIEAMPDGSFLILESHGLFSRVFHVDCKGQLGNPFSLEDILAGRLEDAEADTHVLGHDLAYVGEAASGGRLFLDSVDGNQAFAFLLSFDLYGGPILALEEDYYPMRNHGGKALVSVSGSAYYDLGDSYYPLARQPRDRYETEVTFTTEAFDGRERDVVWHRLALDALIPRGAQVTVESRAANEVSHLDDRSWLQEPVLYLRDGGSEIPWHQPFSQKEAAREGRGTWELLFQRAVGRYIQLRITLSGNGRVTPKLRALRAYYPRFSYMKAYLPAVYRADEASAHFLDRFLANVEGSFTFLEGRIERAHDLFDPRSVPDDYLPWLCDWLGSQPDPVWDNERTRLFLRHALRLYRRRGTVTGLLQLLRLALDPCVDDSLFARDVCCQDEDPGGIRIVERWLTRSHSAVSLGDPTSTATVGSTLVSDSWQPAQGVEALNLMFQEFMAYRYRDASQDLALASLNSAWETSYSSFSSLRYPPLAPTDETQRQDWLAFNRAHLPFPYAAVSYSHESAWQGFLERRYTLISGLNSQWGLAGNAAYGAFAHVALPSLMPAGNQLTDWLEFVSLYLPITDHAHRFTVLIPIELDQPDAYDRLELARRIVEHEKPAHTVFEVKPYWALFRVGEARLGLDSQVGPGHRFTVTRIGSSYLAEGYLGALPPWNLKNRIVVGRDTPSTPI